MPKRARLAQNQASRRKTWFFIGRCQKGGILTAGPIHDKRLIKRPEEISKEKKFFEGVT